MLANHDESPHMSGCAAELQISYRPAVKCFFDSVKHDMGLLLEMCMWFFAGPLRFDVYRGFRASYASPVVLHTSLSYVPISFVRWNVIDGYVVGIKELGTRSFCLTASWCMSGFLAEQLHESAARLWH